MPCSLNTESKWQEIYNKQVLWVNYTYFDYLHAHKFNNNNPYVCFLSHKICGMLPCHLKCISFISFSSFQDGGCGDVCGMFGGVSVRCS